jgi:hypothetical protein
MESNSYNDSPYKGQGAKTSEMYGSGVDDVDEAFGIFPNKAKDIPPFPWDDIPNTQAEPSELDNAVLSKIFKNTKYSPRLLTQ